MSDAKLSPVGGIHHVTAICGDPQRNVDFYSGVLGLRLVKRTVNFDDPQTYHLYFGDDTGSPGSLITFFPWGDAPPGRVGPGQVAVTSFAVPKSALGFWVGRLVRHGVVYTGPSTRRRGDSDEQVLSFKDSDGMQLEIVATPLVTALPASESTAGVPADSAIRGIHGVTLWESDGAPTASLLVDVLGLNRIDAEDTVECFAADSTPSTPIASIRTVGDFPHGHVSVGTVHHVAWRVSDGAAQLAMRERLLGAGLRATEVIDRKYFTSVYFREPGGVLFEIATDGPGFAIDESLEHLGEGLMLPAELEPDRVWLAAALPPIHAATRTLYG